MISVLSVCGIVVCVVVLNRVLETHAREYTLLVTLCASVAVWLYLSGWLSSTLDFIYLLLDVLGDSDVYSILLKTLGISIVTNLAMDVCKDANQNALSGVVLVVGKVAILSLAIPLLRELFYTVQSLIYS